MKIEGKSQPEYLEGNGFLVDENQECLTKVYFAFSVDPDEQKQAIGFISPKPATKKRVEVSVLAQQQLEETDGDWFLKTKDGKLLLKFLQIKEVLKYPDFYYNCIAELLE